MSSAAEDLALPIAAVAVVGLVALWVWKKGGIAGAAASVARGAANAAGGAVKGGVTAASEAAGIPTPDETTTDPAVARWLIDGYGYFEASKWSSVMALAKGAWMDAGTGTPPPAGSAVAKAHPPKFDTIDFGRGDGWGGEYDGYSELYFDP